MVNEPHLNTYWLLDKDCNSGNIFGCSKNPMAQEDPVAEANISSNLILNLVGTPSRDNPNTEGVQGISIGLESLFLALAMVYLQWHNSTERGPYLGKQWSMDTKSCLQWGEGLS